MDRIAIAKVYRRRSDRSFSAACTCLERQLNHDCVSRAWYSVMQLITAATYLVLQHKRPPNDQLNWSHKIQGNLFEEIAQNRTGIPRELFSKYTIEIGLLYSRREEADYRVDKEEKITDDYAQSTIESARFIREKVIELVGEWPC